MPKRLLFPVSQLKVAANVFVVNPLPIFQTFLSEAYGFLFTTFEATELPENGDFRENKVRTDS